ncbi:MAG: hypothetical protein HC945_03270 [Nitrosarchaeum sp.]|nr:hypothetical protein [Nitrosarchaeum sp.]
MRVQKALRRGDVFVKCAQTCEFHSRGMCFHPRKVPQGQIAAVCDSCEEHRTHNELREVIAVRKKGSAALTLLI